MGRALAVAFLVVGMEAWGARLMPVHPFRPKALTGARTNPTSAVQLIYGFEVFIYLVNHGNVVQNVTLETVSSSTSVRGNFIKSNPDGSYDAIPGDWYSYLCGPTTNTNTGLTGSGIAAQMPSSLSFRVPASSRVRVSAGVIFHRNVAANDSFTGAFGEFDPALNLRIDEDRGAISGYTMVANRCYSPTSNRTCYGSLSTSPPLDCVWSNEVAQDGASREINGGRPF
jgi:hypothetical protein